MERQSRERFEYAGLKTGVMATNQGILATNRHWKRQSRDSAIELREECFLADTLILD
jgi:hypothetical protein